MKRSKANCSQVFPNCRMGRSQPVRPAGWSALLPRFPWCLGASVPKLFPPWRLRRHEYWRPWFPHDRPSGHCRPHPALAYPAITRDGSIMAHGIRRTPCDLSTTLTHGTPSGRRCAIEPHTRRSTLRWFRGAASTRTGRVSTPAQHHLSGAGAGGRLTNTSISSHTASCTRANARIRKAAPSR